MVITSLSPISTTQDIHWTLLCVVVINILKDPFEIDINKNWNKKSH